MTVVLVRRLPFTAKEVSVIQCMPAPVSPSHMVFAPIAPIVGIACTADAYESPLLRASALYGR
eukprot:4132075-Pleurochrysis_carterae.AAC.1